MVRVTNKTTETALAEKFLQRALGCLLLILALVTLLGLLRLLGLLLLCQLLRGLQEVEEVTASLCKRVSIILSLNFVLRGFGTSVGGLKTYRHCGLSVLQSSLFFKVVEVRGEFRVFTRHVPVGLDDGR